MALNSSPNLRPVILPSFRPSFPPSFRHAFHYYLRWDPPPTSTLSVPTTSPTATDPPSPSPSLAAICNGPCQNCAPGYMKEHGCEGREGCPQCAGAINIPPSPPPLLPPTTAFTPLSTYIDRPPSHTSPHIAYIHMYISKYK
jgi:hypothetical protein